jgi:hypothetical protein
MTPNNPRHPDAWPTDRAGRGLPHGAGNLIVAGLGARTPHAHAANVQVRGWPLDSLTGAEVSSCIR